MLPRVRPSSTLLMICQVVLSALLCISSPVIAKDKRAEDLSDIWALARDNIYPKELSARFTSEVYEDLHMRLRTGSDITVADAINPFLKSLGISHTYVVDEHDLGYYMFRSMFTTRDIDKPTVVHIGAQTSSHKDGLQVDAVLEGSPAHLAGIYPGDIITSVNGLKPLKDSAFFPYEERPIEIKLIKRSGITKTVHVTPVRQSIHAAFAEATRNSVRIIEQDDLRIGYIHLWSGTHQQFLDALKEAVLDTFTDVDGIVLDLRDGYGGAWWPYLDPFFPDTTDYFVAKTLDRNGKSDIMNPPPQTNENYYSGPLVVLINGGVRSGKEALAYQFKKSNRAALVGTTTAGAFVGGLGGFADQDRGFILYLSVFGMYLDDHQIEGKGITPHIEVSQTDSAENDPQLQRAILEVVRQATQQPNAADIDHP